MLQILRFMYQREKHRMYLTTYYISCICLAESLRYIQALPKAVTSSMTQIVVSHPFGAGNTQAWWMHVVERNDKSERFFLSTTKSYKVLLKNCNLDMEIGIISSLTSWYKLVAADFGWRGRVNKNRERLTEERKRKRIKKKKIKRDQQSWLQHQCGWGIQGPRA